MKKKYFPLFFIILAIIISVFCWDKIILNYEANTQSYGEYANNYYNAHNDTLRYIFFVLFPLIVFFVSYLFFSNENTYTIKKVLLDKGNLLSIQKNDFYHEVFFTLIITLLIIEFLILDFNKFSGYLDYFHSGNFLTPASNFFHTKGLWSSSYIDYGLFANFFPAILWKLFNIQTIGLTKLIPLFLLFFNKILLVFLSREVSKNLLFSEKVKLSYFIILSILLVSLVSYEDLYISKFSPRSLLFLSFFLIFFNSLYKFDRFSFSNFVLGLFSIISLLWYIDIGAYINVLLLLILIYFFIRYEFKKCISILAGIALGWTIFIFIIPDYELKEFLSNTLLIYSTFDYIAGLIYPTPFLSGDIRSTRALIFIIISGILVIITNFEKDIKMTYYNKTFFLFLFIASLLVFKSAMTRSDSFHIKASSGPTLFLIYSIGLYFLYNFFLTQNKKNTIISKFNFITTKNFTTLTILFLFLIIAIFKTNLVNLKNLSLSTSKINNLIYQKDEKYLSLDYQRLIKYYKELSIEDSCVQIITTELLLPYLLKKPTCTQFYNMWNSAPNQKKFVKQLKDAKPKIILYSSEKDPFPETVKRIPMVMEYINQNYSFHSKFEFWTFFKLN